MLWSGSDRCSEMTQAWTTHVGISLYYTSEPICLRSLSFMCLETEQHSRAAGPKAAACLQLDSDGGFLPADSANNVSAQ